MKLLIWLYRTIFCRTALYHFNERVFDLCLRGIGILNYEGYKVSGEHWFQNTYLKKRNIKTIIDVGANTDPYGRDLPNVDVYALEPNLSTFKQLKRETRQHKNIQCFPLGLSNKKQKAIIYDISEKGTALATTNKKIIQNLYKVKPKKSMITLTTLDEFVQQHNIKHIDLLKIDTEGSEFNVLLGAKRTLARDKISLILFEFNEMNALSKVHLKDFLDLLPHFDFYRLMPDGMVKLGKYRPILHELFAFQNIVAIKKDRSV